MGIILGVNPVPKKRKVIKKTKPSKQRRGKDSIMPKKRGKKKTTGSAAKSPKTKYRYRDRVVYRYRQAKKKYAAKRAARRSHPAEAMNLGKIVRGAAAASVGMVIAKAAVNKLTDGGSETQRWSWANIFMAAGSSLVAAFALGALFRLKRPTVAMIAAGGVALSFYKIFTCKLAPQWTWTESWFGADEDLINPALRGYGEENVIDYEPVGQLPGYSGMGYTNAGAQVVRFDPTMGATDAGGQTVPFNPAMGSVENDVKTARRVAAAYSGGFVPSY